MMLAAMERSPMMSLDWHSQDWLDFEVAAIRRLAERAGWAAYSAPNCSVTTIRKEAQAFLAESRLFAPHQDDQMVAGLVWKHFRKGWRARENHERRQGHDQ